MCGHSSLSLTNLAILAIAILHNKHTMTWKVQSSNLLHSPFISYFLSFLILMRCWLTNTGRKHSNSKTTDSVQKLSIPPEFLFNDLINSQKTRKVFFLNSTLVEPFSKTPATAQLSGSPGGGTLPFTPAACKGKALACASVLLSQIIFL